MFQRKEEEEKRQAVAKLRAEMGLPAEEASNLSSGDVEDLRLKVREVATGHILHGDEAPKPSQLDAWLETHPGYQHRSL